MYVVQKNHLRTHFDGFQTLRWLTHKCKNLYNTALYTIRTHYDTTGKYLSEKDLFHQVKSHITYQELSSDNAQLTLRLVRQNFKSYFKLLKLKKAGKYSNKTKIPYYLHGNQVAQFIKRQLKQDKDKIRLSLGKRGKLSMGRRYIWLTIPENIRDCTIKMVRIVPKFVGEYFEVEFVYNPEIINKIKFDYTQYLSLDLGLDNFATGISTRETAFILEGRGIKSFNQWWNKEKAELQSVYDKQKIKKGRQMLKLNVYRYNTMRNFIAHNVHYVIQHCLENKIGNVIVGDWEDMKRGLKMRKKTSQSFQQIPYSYFKKRLRSKCDLYDIKIQFVDESYTSQKCSNCRIIRKANRVKRGLYRCNNCKIERNADINGAINILEKVVPNNLLKQFDKIKWDSGDIISPKRVKLIYFAT